MSRSVPLVMVACVALLLTACPERTPGTADAGNFEPWTLEDLGAGTGVSLRTPLFEVPAGVEIQDCFFVEVPDVNSGQSIWVDRILSAINPGSHHMNVFRVKTIYALDPQDGEPVMMGDLEGRVVHGGECWNTAAWADWPLVANSQNSDPNNPYTDWTLPDGVALKLEPGELLMIQVHYVNATTQETPFQGKVGINFFMSTDANPAEMGTLFATQQSIRICQSDPRPTYGGTCALPAGSEVRVDAANGHFHSRGERFRIFAWDGISDVEPPLDDLFYESLSWDEPPMETSLDLPIGNGGGIWWTCDYQWRQPEVGCDVVNEQDPQKAGDCCYTFGSWVEYNEHCNVFLYYWPKVNDTDIFCN